MKINTNNLFNKNVILKHFPIKLKQQLQKDCALLTFKKDDISKYMLKSTHVTTKYYKSKTDKIRAILVYFYPKKNSEILKYAIYISPDTAINSFITDLNNRHMVGTSGTFNYSNFMLYSIIRAVRNFTPITLTLGETELNSDIEFKTDKNIYKNFSGLLYMTENYYKSFSKIFLSGEKVKTYGHKFYREMQNWFNFRRKKFTGFKGQYTLNELKQQFFWSSGLAYKFNSTNKDFIVSDIVLKKELKKASKIIVLDRSKFAKDGKKPRNFYFYTEKHMKYMKEKYIAQYEQINNFSKEVKSDETQYYFGI